VAPEALCTIRDRVADRIGQRRFRTWFGDATVFDLEADRLCVTAPNSFVGDWIASNYLNDLRDATRAVLGDHAQVDVCVSALMNKNADPSRNGDNPSGPNDHTHAAPPKAPAPTRKTHQSGRLRGNLDTFVVGPSNQLGYSAAQAVIDSPRDAFRPLFLHGGCGLGKTHLLQGICNGVRAVHPQMRWCYVSGEEFTNEFIYAVKSGRIDAFRQRFRSVDLLVIDDIHFLANKKATQEEFLHTFNAIEGEGRTLVLSSDRHPRNIASLSEPLINRLIAGMVVEIKPPDYSVRREILRRRVAKMSCTVPDDVLDLVARHITRNVRELEGALFKLAALASLMKERVTPELVRTVLADYLASNQGPAQPSDVESIVANYFGVTRERLHSKSRDRTISLARALAMYLVRNHTSLSFPEIGRAMGNKNHSTVVMAVRRVQVGLASNEIAKWKGGHGVIERPLATVLAELEQRLEDPDR
jgi:chromosomal replication initiator protein